MKEVSFKSALDKLCISSKEAVVDGNSKDLDPFKEYLHVERYSEIKIKEIIINSAKVRKPQLILLAGNVGDGKSHLLSRLNRDYEEVMSVFKIRNDATESNSIHKSWEDELEDFLEDFNDLNIGNSLATSFPKKIVAINLGILTLFLNSKGDHFTELKKYVKDEKILEIESSGNSFREDSFFQFINLANFNLFTLKDEKSESYIIEELLRKLTCQSVNNPFYQSYLKSYNNTNVRCPIKYNYDFLSNKLVQHQIANLLVQVIIKFKLIISIRDLLNFFYDIIVPIELSKCNSVEISQFATSIDSKDFLKYALITNLFESEGTSKILDAVSKLDPAKYRNEEIDYQILKIKTNKDIVGYFESKNILLNKVLKQYIQEESDMEKVVSLFLRSECFIDNKPFVAQNEMFNSYIRHLYWYNIHDNYKLKDLYKNVKKAIYQWNGSTNFGSGKNNIIVPIGRRQLKYRAIQDATIQVEMSKDKKKEVNEIQEFDSVLRLKFRTSSDQVMEISIDYNLFCLLSKVISGYRPNRIDRYNHADFDNFVKIITLSAGAGRDLNFVSSNGDIRKSYVLRYEEGIGYEFENIN